MKNRKYYDVWKDYDDFIKSLHLSKKEEEKSLEYAKKLFIVFFSAFLTTAAFYFFMEPNGIYNSGINGLIQAVTKYVFDKAINTYLSWRIVYYSSVVLVNIIIIGLTQIFLQGNFWISSTSIFYVISQFIWNNIFSYFSLKDYLFNRLNQQTWKNISGQSQLAFTITFYMLMGWIASFLHTYGYSFIYKAKSSPGGFDIITSALSSQDEKKGENKKKFSSIGKISQNFGLLVLLVITIFDFRFVQGNNDILTKQLIKKINYENENNRSSDSCKSLIKKIINKEKIEKKQEIFQILEKIEEKKEELSKDEESFVRKINSFLDLEKEDVLTIISYLKEGKESLLKIYEKKIENEKDNEKKIENIKAKIRNLKDEIYKPNISDYLRYLTNNEKFWGSIAYIYFSKILINHLFPKNKIIKISFFTKNDIQKEELLSLLKNHYKIYYFEANSPEQNSKEEKFKVVCCLITKWNYQLISDELKKFEKVEIFETDE